MEMNECPVCLSKKVSFSNTSSPNINITCPRCLKYRCTLEAAHTIRLNFGNLVELQQLSHWEAMRRRANASSWIRENTTRDWEMHPIITNEINKLMEIVAPSFHARAEKLLAYLESVTEYPGQKISVDDRELLLGVTWSVNDQELLEYFKFQSAQKRIEVLDPRSLLPNNFPTHTWITPEGWGYLEELRSKRQDSSQGFIAMSFDPSMKPIQTEALEPAIYDAGYKPHRVDQREHTGRIDDEIVAQIRNSRFVVADLTGQRAGVYWEAGFAKGLGLDVVLTCRKDELGKIHFDLDHYNCIDWENEEELKKRLTTRIVAVIGRGPLQCEE